MATTRGPRCSESCWCTRSHLTNKVLPFEFRLKGLIEFLFEDDLVCGFRIYWPNGQHSQYTRTTQGAHAMNFCPQIEGLRVQVGIYASTPGIFSPLVEDGDSPVTRPLRADPCRLDGQTIFSRWNWSRSEERYHPATQKTKTSRWRPESKGLGIYLPQGPNLHPAVCSDWRSAQISGDADLRLPGVCGGRHVRRGRGYARCRSCGALATRTGIHYATSL